MLLAVKYQSEWPWPLGPRGTELGKGLLLQPLLWSLVPPRGQCGCGPIRARATQTAPWKPKDLLEEFIIGYGKKPLFSSLLSYCWSSTVFFMGSTRSVVADWGGYSLYFSNCYFLIRSLNFTPMDWDLVSHMSMARDTGRQSHHGNHTYALHLSGALQFWKSLHVHSRGC